MMKKIILPLLGLSALSMWAESISPQQAQSIAQQFLQQKGVTSFAAPQLAYKAPRRGAVTATRQSAYYVFNAPSAGYVVVAGDDRCASVLGYSAEGRFDMATAPEHVRAFLQSYADELRAIDSMQTAPLRQAPAQAQSLRAAAGLFTDVARRSLAPMLSSTWNQSAPYNNNAPTTKDGNRGVTGCVATMTAQLMYFHRHPAATIAAIPAYVTRTQKLSLPGYEAGSKIDWDNLRPNYTSSNTAAENSAVAHLMMLAGTAVEMDFQNGYSSAYVSKAAEVLRTKFGYDDATRYVSRSNYTADGWNELVYNELLAGRIVGFGGQSSGGGHAFVIDGYDSDGLFHVNWGWGGTANGYFRLSILAPGANAGIGASTSSDGYSLSQEAIIGLQKDDGVPYAPEYTGFTRVKKLSDTTWNVSGGNSSSEATRVEWGYYFGEVDSTPDPTQVKYIYGGTLQPRYYYTFPESYFQKPENPQAGHRYQLYLFWKTSTSKGWQYDELSNANIVYLNYDAAKQASYEVVTESHKVQFVALQEPETYDKGKTVTLHYRLRNQGRADYMQQLQLKATYNGQTQIIAQSGMVIAAGKEEVYTPSFVVPNATQVDFSLVDEGGELYHHSCRPADVAVVSVSAQAPVFTSVSGSRSYDPTLAGTCRVTNNTTTPFKGVITFVLWEGTPAGSYLSWPNKNLNIETEIPANSTKTLAFAFPEQVLNRYVVSVIANAGDNKFSTRTPEVTLSKPLRYYDTKGEKFNLAPSATFTTPAEAVFVDLAGVNVTTIVPNANPNTIYQLSASQTQLRTQLAGKNVVVDDRAERIALSSEYPCFVPVSFTAAEVVYTQSVGEGAKSTNDAWVGFVLPFVPTEVRVKETNEAVTWRRERGDEGRFWIKELVGAKGDRLFFDHVRNFQPYTPYIAAFPGDRYGAELSLANKHLCFTAQNVQLRSYSEGKVTTSAYRFRGSTSLLTATQAYCLDATGSKFVYTPNYTGQPYNTIIELRDLSVNTYAPALSIGSPVVTGIEGLNRADDASTVVKVFDLSGKLLGTAIKQGDAIDLTAYPRGVYVVEGKKLLR